MTKVFISYSHADQPFATRLANSLPALGIEPWIDHGGIHGGARWSSSVQQALDECEALILVLSPDSMASGNVEDEWQYALDKGKPVLPILLKPTDVHFQLGRIQYTDFHGQPFETGLPRLAEGLGQALSRSAESSGAGALDEEARSRAAHAVSAIGPPTGTVTFLFTDIEGSTGRWEGHPGAMPAALERHDDLMRTAVVENGGYVFKTIGDAFCAAFARAGDALAAAVAAQRDIAGEEWSAFGEGFPPLAIRMGLHTGEAIEREGDYFGPAVNRVARLEAAGHGGQLLISQSTQLVVRDTLPEGCSLRDRGEHRLKDLRHSEHIYQLEGPGLPDVQTLPVTAEEADLRDRIACGYVVGDLGDPRLEHHTGPHGEYLLPPFVELPAGTYPIGDDEPITNPGGTWTNHVQCHDVEIEAFEIGQFAVTNAEWSLFQESGGYEDKRWWDTEAGRAWRSGENTAAGMHAGVKWFVARCRERPEQMDELLAAGSWDEEMYQRGQRRAAMSEDELDAHLRELLPGGRHTEPAFWRDGRFNHASQPVVGICWYEARAYLSWLSAQSGQTFRLPSEVEWEAAARGAFGRRYAYGDDFNSLNGNTAETHIRQTTPIGVFPDGDTPEMVTDLTGNVFEWTSSAYGEDLDTAEFPYPYDPLDGREEPAASAGCQRVSRGGSCDYVQSLALAADRDGYHPGYRNFSYGFRVVCCSAFLSSPDSGS